MGWVFAVFSVLGILIGRTHVIEKRAGVIETSAVQILLNLIAYTLTMSLLIWGFATLHWAIPIAVFLCGSFFSGLVITRANWVIWSQIRPVLDFIVVLGCLYIWLAHWPF